MSLKIVAAALVLLTPLAAVAQQQPPAPPPPNQQWENLPRMVLEQNFAGPLRDTLIQRWRDPQTGATCYLYLPISVPYSPGGATGYVQYGGNGIGNISCLPLPVAAPAAAARPPAATNPAPARPATPAR